MTRQNLLCLIVVSLACGPQVDPLEGGTTGEPPTSTTGTVPTTTTTMATTTPTTATTATTTTTESGSESSDNGSTFVPVPDVANECSFWEQDCPRGQKCTFWSDDGTTWNAVKCVEVVDDPGHPGDPCEAPAGPTSGEDTCDATSMCWDIDPETLVGYCVGFCLGSRQAPTCAEPNSVCTISGSGVLALCFPQCDPLAQDCGEGSACYQVFDAFLCAPDASGAAGGFGDACEFINACDPGLGCVNASGVPGCEASGCCTPFCDHTLTNTCPDVGLACVPAFAEGRAPLGYEHIGYCSVP